MELKKIKILLCFLVLCIYPDAQIIIPKEEALIEINYNKITSIDTVGNTSLLESPMVLRVGKTSSMFYPLKLMFLDSLNYFSNNAGYQLISEAMMRGEPTANISGWENEYLFRNVNDDETMVCKHIATYFCGYKEKTVLPEWTIDEDSTTQILGYECLLASCRYRGRDWEAWFTPDIPLSEGPWKIAGLPGMVLRANDMKRQYVYEATSIKTKGLSKVGIFLYRTKPLDMMKDRKAYLRALYHLELKGKFMNEVSLYTDFKASPKDKIPRYDFEEIDYQH